MAVPRTEPGRADALGSPGAGGRFRTRRGSGGRFRAGRGAATGAGIRAYAPMRSFFSLKGNNSPRPATVSVHCARRDGSRGCGGRGFARSGVPGSSGPTEGDVRLAGLPFRAAFHFFAASCPFFGCFGRSLPCRAGGLFPLLWHGEVERVSPAGVWFGPRGGAFGPRARYTPLARRARPIRGPARFRRFGAHGCCLGRASYLWLSFDKSTIGPARRARPVFFLAPRQSLDHIGVSG